MGRLHTVAEARAAFDIAQKTFGRTSFDLIYARQNQTLERWRAELREALSMAADHLSLYQLTIEDGTAFGDRHARGKLAGVPPDDDAADMYFATQEICESAGFPGYEVSNHGNTGAESRHNLIYWRCGDYAGIGPGAHGRLTLSGCRRATVTHTAPGTWLEAVERFGSGEKPRQSLSPLDQAGEYLMMGLRLRRGISLSRYRSLAGDSILPSKINGLSEIEIIRVNGDTLAVSDKGRPLLNSVIRELLPETT